MMRKGPLRIAFGAILGGFAGLSLTTSILPLIVSLASEMEAFMVRFQLGGYASHMALLWGTAAGLVAWRGGPKLGAWLLGGSGLLSGAFLGFLGLGGTGPLMLVSMAGALAYGLIGGVILGSIFPSDE